MILVILWLYQIINFEISRDSFFPLNEISDNRFQPKIGPFDHPKPPKPFIPFPFILDLTYGLLVVGGNIAVALIFQRIDDRLEKESLMKTNAENQLSYLKAQINPHFYMNMLNNIHGMIEINAEKAQSMVLEMSHLMRYMLYDSSKFLIPLEQEIEFLKNYVELMKIRYDESKVNINYKLPAKSETRKIKIPPLLFLAFIENAFKHGISYQKGSFIFVNIEITSTTINFKCINSNMKSSESTKNGVGLKNVRQRLNLLYENNYELDIEDVRGNFIVTLTIPYNEN